MPENIGKLVALVDVVPVVIVEMVTAAANEPVTFNVVVASFPSSLLVVVTAGDFDSGWFGYGRHSCAALRSQRTARHLYKLTQPTF